MERLKLACCISGIKLALPATQIFLCILLSSNGYTAENYDQQQSNCPTPASRVPLTKNAHWNVRTKDDLQGLITALARLPIEKYSNDLLTLDSFDLAFEPVSVTTNEYCDGLISVAHLTVAPGFDNEKLSAHARLMGGPSGLTPSVADDICKEPRLTWMKEFGYTHRYIITTPEGVQLNDFTYDYLQCSKYQEIMGNK